jgi:hypothetical protein
LLWALDNGPRKSRQRMMIADGFYVAWSLCEGEIDVVDGFVDFGVALEADGDAIDAGILERKTHGLLAVFVIEAAFTN